MSDLEDWDFVPGPPQPALVPEPPYLMFQAPDNETPYERRFRMLQQVRRACMACTMCELGWKGVSRDNLVYRDPHVFSSLTPTRFMVVGQNPGWTEVCECTPFVGAAGTNFDNEVIANGLSRDDFYICNTVRCYTQNNQPPLYKHICRCQPFLQIEINLLRPLLVVALGAVAYEALCPDEVAAGGRFSQALGEITRSKRYDVPVFAIYHPSPLNLDGEGRLAMFQKHMRLMCGLVVRLKERHPDAAAPIKVED